MTEAYKYLRTSRIEFTRPFGSCRKLRSVRVATSPGSVEEEAQGPGTEEAGEAGHATGTTAIFILLRYFTKRIVLKPINYLRIVLSNFPFPISIHSNTLVDAICSD